jgi:alanyl aminopeptidase
MWKQLLEQARADNDEKQRGHLFGAMSSFRDEKLVRKNLGIVLSGEFEIFEVGGLLFGALSEEATRDMAYGWIQKNFDTLLEKLPRGFQSVLPRTAGFHCDEEHAQQAKEFFGRRVADIEGGPRALEQTLESIRICAAYREAQRPSITNFLREVEGAGGSL